MPYHDLDSQVRNQNSHFLLRNDVLNRWGNLVASYQMLPGLIGFWPMSVIQKTTGNVYDLSGQARALTYNGNPTYGIHNSIMPYVTLDGTGDFLSRPDEGSLDILGTETIYDSSLRGLTIGGWFYPTDLSATNIRVMGKEDNSTNISYLLYRTTSAFIFSVSSAGNSFESPATSQAISVNNWHFAVGRFDPSTEMAVFVNGTKNTNTTSVPASIFNGTADFAIGAQSGGFNLFTGRCALCFLSANALPDVLINMLFEQSRMLFGV